MSLNHCFSIVMALIFSFFGEVVAADPVAVDGTATYRVLEDLPVPVMRVLKQHRVGADSLSVYVHKIGEPTPLLSWNPDKPRNPASTIKLLTTFVALEELGPAYTWRTEAYVKSPVEGGVTSSDLYLKGYGDPYLVTEYFWRMLRGVRKKGLQYIGGDLVVDMSYFQPEETDPGAFDDQPFRSYNVSPSALMLNFQSIRFQFVPDTTEQKVRISADPDPGLHIKNRIKLTRGRCSGRWVRRIDMKVLNQPKESSVQFSGNFPSACGDQAFYRSVTDAADYVYGVFRNLWNEQGGYFSGKLRQESLPVGADLYYRSDSLALSDIIRAINKYSNNVMTQQLLLTLGAERYGPPGTTEKGIRVLKEWLGQHKFEFPELVLDNGAGLSRDTRISAPHLAQLLLAAYDSPYMPEFMSSLPIAAQDGTLRSRFTNTELEGRLHIKTGLLDDVRGMAGYVLDKNNERWVVVSLHNHQKAPQAAGTQIQDAILQWVYDEAAAKNKSF
ncbi:MAG: D-alanyl-D-alanine carboxypeptidase/D-alanyl-D-alanine-endopeptidase [Gammaproteobacteria bacterium]|nr:D-alanyl-D-alanine carboxypeptidase/D-alanyl-D-alanine-endopeptidase [Gammaproteobacteria bacterium]